METPAEAPLFEIGLRRLRRIEMPVLAQPMLDWLHRNGIEARLSSDDAGGLNPALAFVHGVWLVVPERQHSQAEALAAQFERALTLIDDSFPSEDDDDDDDARDDDKNRA
mgnify:CR=1 FL=1|jgi:hypothetical protein